MQKYLFLIGFVISGNALANSLTIRDIKLLGLGKIEIKLDGEPSQGAFDIDYVRDIVQFSIQNATIYPSKILHSSEEGAEAFSKVFAYQYSPNLVRVRFSVDGKADQLKGKVKWEQKGKVLTVFFPAGTAISKAQPKKEGEATHERSLLAKVLGQGSEEVKVEKIEDSQAEPAKSLKSAVKAQNKAESIDAESQPVLRADKRKIDDNAFENSTKLGGARNAPSPVRSFLAMLLVVGGLGIVLLYVKKKKNSAQAKKVGNSWFSGFLSGSKKQKALIEIIANHPLGPKQSITVVRIRGQQFVLGVTEGNVQLITQLDSDDEIDVLEDPKVADSIGKLFGGKPTIESSLPKAASARAQVAQRTMGAADTASFGNLLKNSSGAGAIVARNAYQNQQTGTNSLPKIAAVLPEANRDLQQSSVRDQIKQRLQGMRN